MHKQRRSMQPKLRTKQTARQTPHKKTTRSKSPIKTQHKSISTRAQSISRQSSSSYTPIAANSAPSIRKNIFSTPQFTQKRRNYNFVDLAGPKDARYLDDGEDWEEPKAKLFDNTLVYASVIIERTPLALPLQQEWEHQWTQYRMAKLTQHSLTIPDDMTKAMYGKFLLRADEMPQPYPHISDDDINNNRHSVYRKLDEPLYLIFKIKQDFDSSLPEEIWTFPTTAVREGETIRSAAERTQFYHAGDLFTYHLGNAPILHHDNKLSDKLKKEYPTAKEFKTFYTHSIYMGGNIELEPDVPDYAWVTEPELAEYFTSEYTAPILKYAGTSLKYLKW